MTTTAPERAVEYFDDFPIGRIHPDPINPRKNVTVDDDFIASVKAGIVEPLVVRPDPGRPTLIDGELGDVLIIAGHRRHLGALEAERDTVPVIVRYDVDDADVLEMMLVENSQRQDLSPLEEAGAYSQLVELGRAQRDIAAKVGRDQGTVSRRLKLLKLPERAKALLDAERISVKTATAMLPLIAHNERISRVLDFACKGDVEDRWVNEKVVRELMQVKVELQLKKRLKDLAESGLTLVDPHGEDFDGAAWDQCDDDDSDATAFDQDGHLWKPVKKTKAKKATAQPGAPDHDDDPDADDEEAEWRRERDAITAASETRKALITNLLGDGYPGDEIATQFALRMYLEGSIENGGADEILDALGVTLPEDAGHAAEDAAVRELDLVRAAFAEALTEGESWSAHGREPLVTVYLQLLRDNGYELTTDKERALFGDTVPDGVIEDETIDLTGTETTADIASIGDTDVEAKAAPAPQTQSPGPGTSKSEETDQGAAASATNDDEPPWDGYENHTIGMTSNLMKTRNANELRNVIAWEQAHQNRAPVLKDARSRLAILEPDTSIGDVEFGGNES